MHIIFEKLPLQSLIAGLHKFKKVMCDASMDSQKPERNINQASSIILTIGKEVGLLRG